jgi:hypothetical protein
MTFGAAELPTQGVDDLRKSLASHESRLANAQKQRDVILIDMRKASAASDLGDQRARLELNALHKADTAAGRLILSIQAQVDGAKKRLVV